MTTKRLGRPPLPASERMDARVTTMVKKPLRDALVRYARRTKVRLAAVVRDAVADYVERRT